ncbi:MAG: ABC transporter permease [bacterium]
MNSNAPNTAHRDARPPGTLLLHAIARFVPPSHRDEWLAEWTAEVTHAWRSHRDGDANTLAAWSLRMRCLGAAIDALWFRRRYGASSRRTNMLAHDLRYAARTLARKPGFTTVVVATLALCIGANTAIFSVINSVLLHGLRYKDIDGLVAVWSNDTRNQHDRSVTSVGDYRDMRARNRTLAQLAAYFPIWNATYTAPDLAERIDVGVVTANLLPVLGVAPAMGRGFVEGDDHPGAPHAVILTHAFWSSRFHEDSSIVGRSVALDGEPYVIVGVMRSDFAFPTAKVDVIAPFPMLGSYLDRREVHLVSMIGRMRAGVSVADVNRDLSSIAAQLQEDHPKEDGGFGATVAPLRTALLGDIRRPILVLFAAVCAVLLIGCANVANLMLARAETRRQELAVRAAMGAEPGAIVRQLLTESALIAAIAGALGVVVALGATSVLARVMPPSIGRIAPIRVDGAVLAFTVVVSIIVAILCGLAPAIQSARSATHTALKDSARGGRALGRRRFQSALVVVELALSLVLAVSAGLLINSFARLTGTNPGFRTDHLVKMKLVLAGPRYDRGPQRSQFFETLLDRIRGIPGVRGAGVVSRFPLQGSALTASLFVEGASAGQSDQGQSADLRHADADYFSVVGIPLLVGRYFTRQERIDSGAMPVAIINRVAALTIFNDSTPVGRRVRVGAAAGQLFEVVGIVGDIHDASLREAPHAQIYLSTRQTMPGGLAVVVRYDGGVGPVLAGVRRALRDIDATTPLYDVQTVDDVMAAASLSDRFTTLLLTAFSALALLLAALGTYGVIAHGVTERTREIGVRMALGAQRGSVLAMVLREGIVLLAIALPLAVAGVLGAAQALRSLLYGVSPLDPMTVLAAAAILVSATLAACYVPARRASRVDPLIAMRGAD